MKNLYTIRPGREADISSLPNIERAAAQLFHQIEWETELDLDEVLSEEQHRGYLEVGRLWVAADEDDLPVGFAVASIIDGHAHLDEIDVHPEHARQGIGRRLIEVVCTWARDAGYDTITLTTERYVPWNAPYYARLGFVEIPEAELTDGLQTILDDEVAIGLNRETRVAMIRRL